MDMVKEFVSFCRELGIVFSIPVVLIVFVCTSTTFKNLEGTKSYAEKHRAYIPFIFGISTQLLFDASYKEVGVSSAWNGIMATVVAVLVHSPLEAGLKKIGIKL
jgi:hypothetical protein